MEKLSEIIVKKYFPGFECFRARDLVTDDEYQIVKNCTLDDLLATESNPAVLEQICEGEKVQTAEYYKHKQKSFQRNLARLRRKPQQKKPRRVVEAELPSTHDNRTAANGEQSAAQDHHVNQASNQASNDPLAAEDLLDPIRSNEANERQHDPYQLVEISTPLSTIQPSAMLPGDDNFGSMDVDGARDFLQLCTGDELPPMSLRESLTRNLIMAQFPSITKRAPVMDNFQELDLRGIRTPMFKRPLHASTPLVASVEQVAQPSLPALDELVPALEVVGNQQDQTVEDRPNATVEAVPPTAHSVPTGDNTTQRNLVMAQVPADERSSSTENSSTALQPRRIRRQVAFTARLEPFPISVPNPKQRQNFDIFSFHYPPIWNKTVQDVQTQLAERWKQQHLRGVSTLPQAVTDQRKDSVFQEQLRDVSIARDAMTDQKIDSGFQQSLDEASRNVPPALVAEISNILTNIQMNTEASSKQDPILTSDLITTMQPFDLDQPGSIDGKLVELPDQQSLVPISTEAPFFNQEKTLTEMPLAIENVPNVQELANDGSAVQPVVVTESRQQKKCPRWNRVKKTAQDDIDPIADLSSILFNQAKESDPIPEENECKIAPLDAMIVDILNVVQTEMCNTENKSVSVQHLEQLLSINSALAAAKTFKNLLFLKTAGLVDIETNSELRITHVSVKLPEVDDIELP